MFESAKGANVNKPGPTCPGCTVSGNLFEALKARNISPLQGEDAEVFTV